MYKYNPHIQHPRSIRLENEDYSKVGLYFITICFQNRESLFGNVENGKMINLIINHHLFYECYLCRKLQTWKK
jgi:hypothetical protein